jgi:hypothetical protein
MIEMLKGHAMIKNFKIPPEINFHLLESNRNVKKCGLLDSLDCLPSQANQATLIFGTLGVQGIVHSELLLYS